MAILLGQCCIVAATVHYFQRRCARQFSHYSHFPAVFSRRCCERQFIPQFYMFSSFIAFRDFGIWSFLCSCFISYIPLSFRQWVAAVGG